MAPNKAYTGVEFRATIFLIFSVGLFVGMLLVYGKVGRFLRETHELHAIFSSVENLRSDAKVRYNGVEVGSVRSMRIVHLDRRNLDRLLPLKKSDLELLPLSDAKRMELWDVEDREFDRLCRQALEGKTMIELTLEVLQEGDYRRYHVDDSIRIGATVLGDAAVDIIAGRSRPLGLKEDRLLLGSAGNFFSNLARSVDQVKDVLSSITDVVGAEERRSFEVATNRLGSITTRFGDLAKVSSGRVTTSLKRFSEVEKSSGAATESIGQFFENVQPDASRMFGSIELLEKDLSKRFSDLLTEVNQAEKDFKGPLRLIAADVDFVTKQSAPQIEDMKTHLWKLADKAQGVSAKADRMYDTLSMAAEQSMPEIERFMASIAISAENLLSMRYIRERTGEIIGKRDLGEHNFYMALDTYDRLVRIARWPRDTVAELAELKPWVARTNDLLPSVKADDITRLRKKIENISLVLSLAANTAMEALHVPFAGIQGPLDELPPFERKRSGER